MAHLAATIDVSDEVMRCVERKIAAAKEQYSTALESLAQAECLLSRLSDEDQPSEPYWTAILDAHRWVCRAMRELQQGEEL